MGATSPADAATYVVQHPGSISINDASTTSGLATRLGMSARVTDVNVTLSQVSHTFPDDIDIALISPAGTAVVLMSDACGSADFVSTSFVFDDEAGSTLSDVGPCAGGGFKPTDYNNGDDAWGFPVQSSLSAFDGENPNGNWQLVVKDDSGGDSGAIAGGFAVTISTGDAAITIPAGDTGGGTAQPYPYSIPVSNQLGKVKDVNVILNGFDHTWPDDVDILLVGPHGQKVVVVSDACGAGDIHGDYVVNDEAAAPFPDSGPCPAGSYQPADYEVGDFPAPAPAGPYDTSLSAFDLTGPNGTWKLYVFDDAGTDSGYIIDPQLHIILDPPPNTLFTQTPPRSTRNHDATFKFKSNEHNVTFQCKLDARRWRSCSSPYHVTVLPGSHTLLVRAKDSAGSYDPTPAKWRWRVLR